MFGPVAEEEQTALDDIESVIELNSYVTLKSTVSQLVVELSQNGLLVFRIDDF